MAVKLSEAMRLGAMLSEQGYGIRAMTGEDRCALGAALAAVHTSELDPPLHPKSRWHVADSYAAVRTHWPWTLTQTGSCPVCARASGSGWRVLRLIAHLNDQHRWTREQTAAWVAMIEPVVDTPEAVCPPLAGVEEMHA